MLLMELVMRHLALFGGSFDPVHLGHLLVAQAAREELALNRLFFIPAAQSPFKPDRTPTPANERLRLLRLALAGSLKGIVCPSLISVSLAPGSYFF
jgi:nicotinate-nucleotide adenylyltransferase